MRKILYYNRTKMLIRYIFISLVFSYGAAQSLAGRSISSLGSTPRLPGQLPPIPNVNILRKCMVEGKEGICINIYNCLTVVVDKLNNELPPVCGFDGVEPLVCCTSCDIVGNVSKAVINDVGPLLWKTGQKAWDKCIDYLVDLPYRCKDDKVAFHSKSWNDKRKCYNTRVDMQYFFAEGSNAERGQFPHMALLGYGTNLTLEEWLCGGSVISEKYILTAAHCLSAGKRGPVKFAALGILKRTDPANIWERYNIKRRMAHPQYKPPSKYHDIALLETETTIKFSIKVLPACLAMRDIGDAIVEIETEWVSAAGWGALNKQGPLADTLQYGKLEKFSHQECNELYPEHRLLERGYDHQTQMCYGDRSVGRDTCEGDSGGPLLNSGQTTCQQSIIGVTSSGKPCGSIGGAGLYTRVEPYIPWIEDIVWK